jgi:hypothetical protein
VGAADRQSRHAEQLVVVANGAAQRASVGAKDSLASALNWTRSRPWNTIANHTFLVRGGFHVDGTETRRPGQHTTRLYPPCPSPFSRAAYVCILLSPRYVGM